MSINESARPLPEIFVDSATINKRVKLFIQNKYPILNEGMMGRGIHKPETKSIWYSKSHIETWLEEMNDLKANGMRIYFGEYEAPDADTTGHEAPNGQLCLLMVLTREGSEPGKLKNIFYEREPNYEARKMNTTTDKAIEEGVFDDLGKDRNFNFGAYCPPICLTEGDDYPNDSVT